MSESEVDSLRRDMARMHESNQRERVEDRKALHSAMNAQGDRFERGLESVRDVLVETRDQGRDNAAALVVLTGDGSKGAGRVGGLEDAVEKLKQFRWQALAALATLLFLAKLFWGK